MFGCQCCTSCEPIGVSPFLGFDCEHPSSQCLQLLSQHPVPNFLSLANRPGKDQQQQRLKPFRSPPYLSKQSTKSRAWHHDPWLFRFGDVSFLKLRRILTWTQNSTQKLCTSYWCWFHWNPKPIDLIKIHFANDVETNQDINTQSIQEWDINMVYFGLWNPKWFALKS